LKHFQHLILGTGQATGTLLGHLIPTGESIAVVEGDRVGGTCLNTGCTPTKALVATAKVARMVSRASEYGIEAGAFSVDFAAVRARMNEIRDNSGMESWIRGTENITFFQEWGRFESPNQIRVGDESVTADRIYINAGARPRVPDVPGLDSAPWLDHAALLEVTELPEHLVIMGGSYIGLEFGQVFRRLGSRVTIIERNPGPVFREDEDVSLAIRDILEAEGINFHFDSQVVRVEAEGSGVAVTVLGAGGADGDRSAGGDATSGAEGDASGEELVITGSHLLVAVGRVPNSDTLDVAAAGIELDDRGFIVVDDCCRTNVDGVFALGDINGHGAFTHTSVNDAEIVVDLMTGGTRKLSDRIPVYALFMDPPLGRVGLSERQAVEQGYNVLKATRQMSKINRAKEMGETQGFAKLLVDGDTDRILGAAILGPGGDEIINMFAAYMYSGLPCRDFRKSVLVHPTVAELMPWILDTLKPV
jgi:pyruvate/2-oxoglutarate dehydrogenase complex dihydrolipoamide dehydrogenase (E3) component